MIGHNYLSQFSWPRKISREHTKLLIFQQLPIKSTSPRNETKPAPKTPQKPSMPIETSTPIVKTSDEAKTFETKSELSESTKVTSI